MDEQPTEQAATPLSLTETHPTEGAPPSGRWAGRVLIGLLVVALVAGAVVVLNQDSSPDELQPLALGGVAAEAGAADMAAMPFAPFEYVLAGPLPDLGSEAPVYRLVAPAMDASRVASYAVALGVGGEPVAADGGWVVDDGSAYLVVTPVPGGWSLSYGLGSSGFGMSEPGYAGDAPPAAVEPATGGGADGVVGSDDATVAAGGPDGPVTDESATRTTVEDVTVEDVTAETTVTTLASSDPLPPPTLPPGPEDLPSAAEAEAIARDTLDALGVLDGADWVVETNEGGLMSAAAVCADSPDGAESVCSEQTVEETVLSWSVTFRRIVDGVTTSGLEWSVDVGDRGVVQGLWGTVATLSAQGDYPLRSTQAVYDDMVAGRGVYGGPMPLGVEELGAPVPDVVDDVSTEAEDLAARDGAVGASVDPDTPVSSDGTMDAVAVDEVPLDCTEGEPCASPGSPGDAGDAGDDVAVPPDVPDTLAPDVLIDPMPEPEPVVITVTGAERTALVQWGTEDGAEVQYLVPGYRFLGTFPDGSAWSAEWLALDPAFVAQPEPLPVPEPLPEPEPVPEPQPEPVPETTVPEPVTTVVDPPFTAVEPPETVVEPEPEPTPEPQEPVVTTIPVTTIPQG